MKTLQFREAIAEAMSEEMRKDPSIYLMGEEVAEYNGAYKASKGMLDEFGPERVIDTPISELGFAGIGIGSAMNGNKPIIEFMTFNFALVGIDQIINNAAKIRQMSGGQFNCPIVFRGPTGSAGQLGATHSQAFENWFANTPGLKVVYPAFPYDAKGLLITAIEDPNPVLFFEHKALYRSISQSVPNGYYNLPIGKAALVKEGTEATIITYGAGVHWALETLEKHPKLSLDLIDLRTLMPLDWETIYGSVKKTSRLIILQEDSLFGGISSDIAASVQEELFEYLDAPIKRVASLDTPIPFAKSLENEYLPRKRFEKALLELINF